VRYYPGTIALSEARDLPLLRIVLHSRFISHKQLFELARYETFEPSKTSLSNRMQRLCSHGLLQAHNVPDAGRVYSITTGGLGPLIRSGEPYTLAVNEKVPDPKIQLIAHCLDINDIHLSLRRSGLLSRWIHETQVRSRNELTNIGYAKDYDGVFSLRFGKTELDSALEYERSPKAIKYYDWIRERMEAETQVDLILYICANFDLLSYVSARLRNCNKPIYFGLLGEFIRAPRSSRLILASSPAATSFDQILNGGSL